MPIKYTQTTLDKIVKVLNETGYVLRFEKGTFNSGFCILEHKKVVVVNKFLNLEGRINTLMDIVALLKIDENILSVESKKVYAQAVKEAQDKTALSEEQADDQVKDSLEGDDTEKDDLAKDDAESDHSGKDETEKDDGEEDHSGKDDTEKDDTEEDNAEKDDTEKDDTEKDDQKTP